MAKEGSKNSGTDDNKREANAIGTNSVKASPTVPAPSGENSDSNKSFLDILYQQIVSVMGGDNPNQYFCLNLPGTLINAEEYTYDTNGEKPAHVKANESKLVNKLFDACFVTAADNGKQLSNQYRTALNMLSPKLNKNLFEMKVQLRKVLMTPYPYNFDGKMEETMTLEQVFYRLYSEYVSAKEKWNQKQLDKKEELKKNIIDPKERRDAYLEWYGLVAETENVILEEKLGKVLNVFSPSDMNIINAILNCGTCGEIENARSAMNMVEELSPDGGYVYPVNLYPRNWFNLLDSSFTEIDLLESAPALAQKLKVLKMQRSNLMLNITKLLSTLPDEKSVKELEHAYEEAQSKMKELTKACLQEQGEAGTELINSIISLCKKNNETLEGPSTEEVHRVSEGKGEDIPNIINKVMEKGLACYNAQAELVDASKRSTEIALKWCEENNRQHFKKLLESLKVQLDSVNEEISELESSINISRAMFSDKETNNNVADIMPNQVPEGFTQVLIQSKMSSISQKSGKTSESSNSTWGTSFLFGGYAGNKSNQNSVESMTSTSSDMDIQIGMNLAKVQIERGWFNPGIFLLTNSMYNFSNSKIAPSDDVSFTNGNQEEVQKRFDAMNKCIFPSYPVAFVIAKDVSIRFTSQTEISSSFAERIEEHASQGGGFLIFSGNSSTRLSDSKSAANTNVTSKSITIRFTTPQIIGYYIQATPADESENIKSTTEQDMSVIEFVSKFKEMLEDYSHTAGIN